MIYIEIQSEDIISFNRIKTQYFLYGYRKLYVGKRLYKFYVHNSSNKPVLDFSGQPVSSSSIGINISGSDYLYVHGKLFVDLSLLMLYIFTCKLEYL